MQAHVVQEQSEAYLRMAHFESNLDQDNEIVGQSMRKAKSDWPEDYAMQLHVFDEQMQAAIAFFDYENVSLPSEILNSIKIKAFSEWTGDYSMMLYTLNDQVAGWMAIHGEA